MTTSDDSDPANELNGMNSAEALQLLTDAIRAGKIKSLNMQMSYPDGSVKDVEVSCATPQQAEIVIAYLHRMMAGVTDPSEVATSCAPNERMH